MFDPRRLLHYRSTRRGPAARLLLGKSKKKFAGVPTVRDPVQLVIELAKNDEKLRRYLLAELSKAGNGRRGGNRNKLRDQSLISYFDLMLALLSYERNKPAASRVRGSTLLTAQELVPSQSAAAGKSTLKETATRIIAIPGGEFAGYTEQSLLRLYHRARKMKR